MKANVGKIGNIGDPRIRESQDYLTKSRCVGLQVND